MSPLGFAKAGLISGGDIPYEGTNVSADLLWHLKKIPVSAFSTTYDVTTANGYESNGINVGGTTYDANIIVYDGNQTWGSGSITGSGNKLVMNRINGNLTVSSGFTATTSGTCNGLYIYVDGDLTVDGSISMYNKGREISGGVSTALQINSSANEVAGSSTIKITGSEASHTNGSSTASALTTGGGGRGGSGSYGRGEGATGHIFSGGSGGGGSGGIGYYNFYQGGGGAGGTATSYAGKGGNGGASGYTNWGYATADAGGSGGTGNGGGNGGTNNSRNASDSRAGYAGDTGTPASMVIYATGNITIASGGSLYTTGRNGRSGDHHRLKAGGGGGSAGAVLVAICGGTFTNNGTVSSAGGSAGAGKGSGTTAGSGGKLTGGGYS
jgi:hypothetical protein